MSELLQVGWVILNRDKKSYYVVTRREWNFIEVRYVRAQNKRPIMLRWPIDTHIIGPNFIRVA